MFVANPIWDASRTDRPYGSRVLRSDSTARLPQGPARQPSALSHSTPCGRWAEANFDGGGDHALLGREPPHTERPCSRVARAQDMLDDTTRRPVNIDRRRFLGASIGATGAGLLAACSDDGPTARPSTTTDASGPSPALEAPGSTGLVGEDAWQARVDDYLRVVTAETDPESQANVAAHLIRSAREPGYVWDASSVTVESFQAVWDKLDAWEDTRDFRFLDLHWLLHLADGGTEMTTLDPAIIEAAETRMAANRWRYDDPLPDGRIDDQWFWSENHLIIGLCGEYLSGQRLPDTVFEITGLTGSEHLERSQAEDPRLDRRARPIRVLRVPQPRLHDAEHHGRSPCWRSWPRIPSSCAPPAWRSISACSTWPRTPTGAPTPQPRGRTYKKDKSAATDENTFTVAKFLFDDTELPYRTGADGATTYFCAAAALPTAPGHRRHRRHPGRVARARASRHLRRRDRRRSPPTPTPRSATTSPIRTTSSSGGPRERRHVAARRRRSRRGRALPHLRDQGHGADPAPGRS